MCGRYVLTFDYNTLVDILKGRFDIENLPQLHQYEPHYNIAPSQQVLSLINHEKSIRIGNLRWGLIPPWAQDEKIGYKMINARGETVHEKPAYRHAFYHRRCLILANGFYEWRREGRMKIPMFITLKSGDLFAMAGLYSIYYNKTGEKISTCTIITTTPNDLMANIHDRMPVILDKKSEHMWLDTPHTAPDQLRSLLRPLPSEYMTAYQVSSLVNSAKYDSPECIEPFQGTLF